MTSPLINSFLSGALMLAFAAIACFFLEYFRRTRDRLFLCFALAFFLLAIERVVLVAVSPRNEINHLVYTVRLAAFVSLAYGIWDRNLRKP
jgi:hypothetical protein